MEVKQVIVRPITKNRSLGVSSFSKTQTVINGAEIDSTGLFATGLTRDEEDYYEKELNLPKGSLNKRSPFWADLEIRLNNDKITIVNVVSLMDELKYKMMLVSSKIAPSEDKVAKMPSAEFFVYDPEATAKIESAKIDFELQAFEAFNELSLEERKNLLRVYGKRGVDDMSETMVRTELYKFVKADPEEFYKVASKKETQTKGLLESLVEKGLIRKKGHYYYNGEDLIASSTDDAVAYLQDPKNQAHKLALESRLKSKKK